MDKPSVSFFILKLFAHSGVRGCIPIHTNDPGGGGGSVGKPQSNDTQVREYFCDSSQQCDWRIVNLRKRGAVEALKYLFIRSRGSGR